jgi:hypothetical protein
MAVVELLVGWQLMPVSPAVPLRLQNAEPPDLWCYWRIICSLCCAVLCCAVLCCGITSATDQLMPLQCCQLAYLHPIMHLATLQCFTLKAITKLHGHVIATGGWLLLLLSSCMPLVAQAINSNDSCQQAAVQANV